MMSGWTVLEALWLVTVLLFLSQDSMSMQSGLLISFLREFMFRLLVLSLFTWIVDCSGSSRHIFEASTPDS